MSAPKDCARCSALVKCRKQVVNGAGVRDAKIAFVGEGPGAVEDDKGRPFIGKAGRVLHATQWAAGINQHKSYHTNATRCWGKRNPKPDEIDACHDYLIEELRQLNPAVIVSLGAPALRSLYRPGVSIGAVMGFTLYNDELPGIPIIPTYHPSYIMRGHWGEVGLVLSHFRKAQRIAEVGKIDSSLGSYAAITTLEDLAALRDYLLGPDVALISVDTETTGLSWMDSELLCVQFSGEEGTGFSVPILHRGTHKVKVWKGRGKNRKMVEEEEWWPVPFWDVEEEMPQAIAILDEILRSDKPKAGQNIGFDLRMLERSTEEVAVKAGTAFGFHVNNVKHDTRMLSSLLSEVSPANLTALTSYWTDMPYYEEEIAPYKSKMWHLPDQTLWDYGAADTDATHRVQGAIYPKVQEEGTEWAYDNISIPLIRCATKMEERGVYIDQDYFDRLCGYYKEELANKRAELNGLVGHEVEHATHWQHLQKLVFGELKLPLTKTPIKSALKNCDRCRKDRSPCSAAHAATGGDELLELHGRAPHPVLPVLADVRSLEKINGTYLEGEDDDNGAGGFRPYIREDGRIHARWNAARASSGRFSCEAPNLMNPPKEVKVDSDKYGIHSDDAIRAMFAAPPGYGLLNADWSQAEVWVMAYETGDDTLLGLLKSGSDIHAYVARELCKLGVSSKFPNDIVDDHLSLEEWKNAHPSVRGAGKTFVFGMNYGLTEEGAADRLGCSKEEAAPLLQHYVQHIFPGMGPYFLRIRDELFRTGTISNKFGRRAHHPEVPILAALRYKGDLEGSMRQGFNMPIQSGAHDLHSLAHIATERELSSYVGIVLEMHDSLLKEAPEDRLDEAKSAIMELWSDVARNTILPSGQKLGWEIPVDVQYGRSFGELK